MRRWLSDSAVCFGHSGWLQDGLSYHAEYLQDVIKCMWKFRPKPETKVRKEAMKAENYCEEVSEHVEGKSKLT